MKSVRVKMIAGFMGVILVFLVVIGVLIWQNGQREYLVSHDLANATQKLEVSQNLAYTVILALMTQGAWSLMAGTPKVRAEMKSAYDKTVSQVTAQLNVLQTFNVDTTTFSQTMEGLSTGKRRGFRGCRWGIRRVF